MSSHIKAYSKTSPVTSFEVIPYNVANVYINQKLAPVQQSESGESQRKVLLTNFLKVFFDFAYFLLASPFRISLNEHNKFVIKKFKPQQACCFLMQLLCTIRLLTEVRTSIEKEYRCKSCSQNPVQYFNIILDICSLIYKLVTMKRLWFNQMDYLNVLNYIHGNSHFESNCLIFIQKAVFLCVIMGIGAVQVFASLLAGKKFISQSSSWSSSLWRSQIVRLARFTFFFSDSFKSSDTSTLENITCSDDFLAFLMSLCMLGRYVFGLFSDVFLFCFAMTLWIATKSYSRCLLLDSKSENVKEDVAWIREESKNDNKENGIGYKSWTEVYEHYRSIQRLARKINMALGSKVTWYMAEAVMYYSIYLNAVLTSADVFVRIDLTFFYFTTVGILIFSADICNQLENIKLWISHGENRKTVPKDELTIVLHEMIAKDIGIRGSNIFTITYSLLAMFFSTIVTYFIICIQQGHGDNSDNPRTLGSENNKTNVT